MSRKPTPNIMDELLPAKSETTELRAGLRWDYSQLGDAAGAVIEHAVEIKRSERRASEAIVEAGRHLIAVKQAISHGQWEDWLQTEFAMSDRTAQRMMAVARQFDGKTDTVSLLQPSVLYLLAGDSVPEPARETVIDLAKNGETVTKAQAQAVIDQHKPQPRTYASGLPVLDLPLRMAAPPAPAQPPSVADTLLKSMRNSATLDDDQQRITLKQIMLGHYEEHRRWLECFVDLDKIDPADLRDAARTAYMQLLEIQSQPAIAQSPTPEDLASVVASDATHTRQNAAPLTPEIMATLQPMPAAEPADDRRSRLSQFAAQFEAAIEALAAWAELTGRFTCTSEAERGLRKVLDATRSELAALDGQPPHQVWGEND